MEIIRIKMSNYHYEKSMLESLIYGLKRLYNFLAEREIKKELLGKKKEDKEGDKPRKDSGKFVDDEENKQRQCVIQSLKDIFIIKQKAERDKRLQTNAGLLIFRIPNHIFGKYVLCCMDLKEICKLCLVCVNFNSVIKSNVFLCQYVKVQEKTSININLKAFGAGKKAPPPVLGKGNSSPTKADPAPEDFKSAKEDPEMQLDVQKRMKAFLSAKLQESDEQVAILRNDIIVMKNLLTIEKSSREEAIDRAGRMESELANVNQEKSVKELELGQRITELEALVRILTPHVRSSRSGTRKTTAPRKGLRSSVPCVSRCARSTRHFRAGSRNSRRRL